MSFTTSTKSPSANLKDIPDVKAIWQSLEKCVGKLENMDAVSGSLSSMPNSSMSSSDFSPISSPPPEPKRSEIPGGQYYLDQWRNQGFNYSLKFLKFLESMEMNGKRWKLGSKSKIRIDRLLLLLKLNVGDPQRTDVIVSLISKLFEGGTIKYKQEMIKNGLTNSMLEALVNTRNNLVIDLLTSLIEKDKKFALKARLQGVLESIATIFCEGNARVFPILLALLQNESNSRQISRHDELSKWIKKSLEQVERMDQALELICRLSTSQDFDLVNITKVKELYSSGKAGSICITILSNLVLQEKHLLEFLQGDGLKFLQLVYKQRSNERACLNILKTFLKFKRLSFWPDESTLNLDTSDMDGSVDDKNDEILALDFSQFLPEQRFITKEKDHFEDYLTYYPRSLQPQMRQVLHSWSWPTQSFPIVRDKNAEAPNYCQDFVEKVLEDNPSNFKLVFDGTTSYDCEPDLLIFSSQFESGNLEKAVYVGCNTYYLFIRPDFNTEHGKHHQWFYFEFKNAKKGTKYTFVMMNFVKPSSSFEDGMQPVFYSEKMATFDRQGWIRMGEDISYFKHIVPNTVKPNSTYYGLGFRFTVPYEDDTCYFAYHYPYTFTDLQVYLDSLQRKAQGIFFDRQCLCFSDAGNVVDLITLSEMNSEEYPMSNKRYIMITSRVHPGESNSSYIMEGLFNFLIGPSDEALFLRQNYIFKIVPMLNPDGVIEGNHRCSLTGVDLNRQWLSPSLKTSRIIWHVKKLYSNILETKKGMISIDLHGHSRKNNIFVFGCPNADGIEKILTFAMKQSCDSIDIQNCKYNLHPSKKTTARMVLWRELSMSCSVTIETSYLGCTIGPDAGKQWTIPALHKNGSCIGYGLAKFEKILQENNIAQYLKEVVEPLFVSIPRSSSLSDVENIQENGDFKILAKLDSWTLAEDDDSDGQQVTTN